MNWYLKSSLLFLMHNTFDHYYKYIMFSSNPINIIQMNFRANHCESNFCHPNHPRRPAQ